MWQRWGLFVARLGFGVLTLTAIVVQLTIHVGNSFDPVNFFSYFTNLSNIFAAVVFIIGAISLLTYRKPTPRDDLIRGAAVVAMAVVGVVFSLLLRNEDLGTLLPWVNFVLHYLMPVVVVVEWLVQPPKSKISFRQTLYWLIYPLLYVVYSLIRGTIVGFYAYPFLNPAKIGGYGVVALYCVGIFVLFLVFSVVFQWLGNRLPRLVKEPAAPVAARAS